MLGSLYDINSVTGSTIFLRGKKIPPKKQTNQIWHQKTSVEHFFNYKHRSLVFFGCFAPLDFRFLAPSSAPHQAIAPSNWKPWKGTAAVWAGCWGGWSARCVECKHIYIYVYIYMFTTKTRKIEIRFISHVCALIYTYMVLMYIIIWYLYHDTLYIVNSDRNSSIWRICLLAYRMVHLVVFYVAYSLVCLHSCPCWFVVSSRCLWCIYLGKPYLGGFPALVKPSNFMRMPFASPDHPKANESKKGHISSLVGSIQ